MGIIFLKAATNIISARNSINIALFVFEKIYFQWTIQPAQGREGVVSGDLTEAPPPPPQRFSALWLWTSRLPSLGLSFPRWKSQNPRVVKKKKLYINSGYSFLLLRRLDSLSPPSIVVKGWIWEFKDSDTGWWSLGFSDPRVALPWLSSVEMPTSLPLFGYEFPQIYKISGWDQRPSSFQNL